MVEQQDDQQLSEGSNDSVVSRRSRWKAWILVACVCVTGIAVNLPYQYEAVSSSGLRSDELLFDLPRSTDDSEPVIDPVLAGWPTHFRIAHRFSSDDNEVQYKWIKLVSNVLFWLFVVAILVWGTRPKPGKKGISLSDLLILVAVIASGMGYWQFRVRQAEADRKVASKLSESGTVVKQSFVPKILKPYLPVSAVELWTRATAVDIQDPTAEQVEAMCRLGHLRSIRIAGGDYDLASLSRLPSMPHLQDLRVAGKELDGQTVLAISDCRLLTQLNISQTNCGPNAPLHLSKLPRLKRLMALETLVPYNAWDQNEIKNRVVSLNLTRPPTGSGGELKFSEWQNLKSLTLRSLDGFSNSNRFRITLHDMPELDSLLIDNFQYVDLDLQRLPKLETVQGTIGNYRRRLADDEVVSHGAWAGKTVLKDMPVLKSFGMSIRGFESIEIENCPSLDSVAATSMVYPGEGDSFYQTDVKDTPAATTQKLVNALGKTQAVKSIGVLGADLSNVDISPLVNKAGLTELDLSSCIIPRKLAKSFADIQLETLDLRKARIESGKMVEVNENLKKVLIDSQVTAIRLENKPNLVSLVFDHHRQSNITALRLVNLPQFESPMVLSHNAAYLHVENVPAMKGLAFLSIRRDISIKGVGGLEWFVGGSALMKDDQVSEVLKAKGLKNVTIAYSAASSDSFAGLFQLPSLVKAVVPGAPLNDEMVMNWEIPASMNELDVRDCGLSAKSIGKIIHRGNWRLLYLSGNEIDPADLAGLSKSRGLMYLDLSGAEIPTALYTAALKKCLNLHTLALSGCKLKKGTFTDFDLLPLAELHLYDAEADWNEVKKVLAENRDLKLGIGATDATVAMVTALTQSKRIVRPPSLYDSMFAPRQLLGYDVRGMPVYQDPTKIEGPDSFEIPDWPVEAFDLNSASAGPFSGIFPGGRAVFQGNARVRAAASQDAQDDAQDDTQDDTQNQEQKD